MESGQTEKTEKTVNRQTVLLIAIIAAVLALCAIWYAAGMRGRNAPRTQAPWDEAAVAAALEKAGMPGMVSESRTYTDPVEYTHFEIRSTEEDYEGTADPVFLGAVSSARDEDGQILITVFNQDVASDRISWEDWEPQVRFAASLYGGFENPDDLYWALSREEIPDQGPYVWDLRLPQGYCTAAFVPRSYRTLNGEGMEVRAHSAFLRVSLYASYGLFEKYGTEIKRVSQEEE